jgi:hypothetical protein
MPTSKELREMADREWQNREERKGIHDKASWTSGWISGYLTRNPQAEREKVLDVLDIELDEVKSRIESSAMGQPLSERSRGEIIGLLHTREKIKYLREGKDGE